MSRRARRGSASDASQQEGEPPADESGGESATALLLSKLAEVTGQPTELQSERAADRRSKRKAENQFVVEGEEKVLATTTGDVEVLRSYAKAAKRSGAPIKLGGRGTARSAACSAVR